MDKTVKCDYCGTVFLLPKSKLTCDACGAPLEISNELLETIYDYEPIYGIGSETPIQYIRRVHMFEIAHKRNQKYNELMKEIYGVK